MSVDTIGLIKGQKMQDVLDYICFVYHATTSEFKSGGPLDSWIHLPIDGNRMIRISENVYGQEKLFNITTNIGDIYLRMGYSGKSVEIMRSILSYFGGYVCDNDAYGHEKLISIKLNYRYVIKQFFELWDTI